MLYVLAVFNGFFSEFGEILNVLYFSYINSETLFFIVYCFPYKFVIHINFLNNNK